MSTRYQQFIGVSVTLTSALSTYSLVTLIQAALTAGNDEANAPTSSREIGIQVHPGASGTLYVGDASVSTTRCAYALLASGTDRDRAMADQIPLSEIYLVSDTSGMRVNVLILQ